MAGLSITQVSTWFINARKRVWKPLIHENADHNELTGASEGRTLDSSYSGPESEPGANSDSDALSDSEFERSARGTVEHDLEVRDFQFKAQARNASKDLQDAEMQDAAEDLAGCVTLLLHDATPTVGNMAGLHAQLVSTTSSPERPSACHVTSPYGLMMQPTRDQHANMVLGRHQHLLEEKQLVETHELFQALAPFPAAFPPCTSPWSDLPFYAAADQFSHTLPPFGTHVGTRNIIGVYTTVTGQCCRSGRDILDFMW